MSEQPNEYNKANPHPDCGTLTHHYRNERGRHIHIQWLHSRWNVLETETSMIPFQKLENAQAYCETL